MMIAAMTGITRSGTGGEVQDHDDHHDHADGDGDDDSDVTLRNGIDATGRVSNHGIRSDAFNHRRRNESISSTPRLP